MTVGGVAFDALTEAEAVEHVRAAVERGEGGRIITPNVDILRRGAEAADYLDDATLVVADGMPLLWAARRAGTPLPERVAGSSLIWSLSRALGADGRSAFLIGGDPGSTRAGDVLAEACPGLRIAGQISPPFGFEDTPDYDELCAAIIEEKPSIVYVGLGFPKQERVITRLRPQLPGTWFLGCGASIQFVAGELRRAPLWMQRSGLEWLHRLLSEPRRLAGRYLVHDLPFALRLLINARKTTC
ncbi:WecB/TagA/CpsF family glycosyltransferase [Longispora albida]|uniref:WecB/TagA/CpsF family glycosyltransferase n=1 Tax=Longispora albida TaxID=203523 RepID=UPI00036B246A|nr:WecB/TagA/CpsF family glycosyltransferase [Longispora albida]